MSNHKKKTQNNIKNLQYYYKNKKLNNIIKNNSSLIFMKQGLKSKNYTDLKVFLNTSDFTVKNLPSSKKTHWNELYGDTILITHKNIYDLYYNLTQYTLGLNKNLNIYNQNTNQTWLNIASQTNQQNTDTLQKYIDQNYLTFIGILHDNKIHIDTLNLYKQQKIGSNFNKPFFDVLCFSRLNNWTLLQI